MVRADPGRRRRPAPALPWQDEQIGRVLSTLDELADVLTPAPISAPTIAEYFGAAFTGWRKLAGKPDDERLDSWSRAHLAELAALERAAEVTALHLQTAGPVPGPDRSPPARLADLRGFPRSPDSAATIPAPARSGW